MKLSNAQINLDRRIHAQRKQMRNQRYMSLAREVASWSKDPSTKVGAVILLEDKVLGLGPNGFARGVNDSPEAFADRESKLGKVIHAEVNAILNAGVPVKGAAIYTTSMCCPACAALIIQVGIVRVVVPCGGEDPFNYRGENSSWTKKVAEGPKDLLDVDIELHVMQSTDFDVRKLMGPDHPYMKNEEQAKSDAIKRVNYEVFGRPIK